MFDRQEMQRAIDLSQAGHRFMKWLGERDRVLVVHADASHAEMSVPEATADWVLRNQHAIPPDCQPASREDLVAFSNLVGTYLDVSFELQSGRQQSNRVCCAICHSLVDMSSLKTRRLTRLDKLDAQRLIACWTRDRAAELGLAIDEPAVARIVDDPATREPLALVTWAHELLRRMEGHSAGPAVLALWRMFAWLPAGSPRPGFQVTADAILDAEAAVMAAIGATGAVP